jgi:hypothetical protein
MPNDIVSRLASGFYNWGASLPDPDYFFFVRTALELSLAAILCGVSISRVDPNRLAAESHWQFVQWALFVGGLIIGSLVPIEALNFAHRVARTLTFVTAVLLVVVMPRVLPMFVIPRSAQQQRMTTNLYLIILILFLINFFGRRA